MYTVQSTPLHKIELVIIRLKARTTGEINCISDKQTSKHTSCGLSCTRAYNGLDGTHRQPRFPLVHQKTIKNPTPNTRVPPCNPGAPIENVENFRRWRGDPGARGSKYPTPNTRGTWF